MKYSAEKLFKESEALFTEVEKKYKGLIFCAFLTGILIGFFAGMAYMK